MGPPPSSFPQPSVQGETMQWRIICVIAIKILVLNMRGTIYIYTPPPQRMYAIMRMHVCTERSHSAAFQCQCVLIYWLCQRIPSDQVQFSSPALISSAHQGSSPVFSLPPSHPSSCAAFDCHPLANADHTIEFNRSWQFKLAPFSPSLQNTSRQNAPRASAAPT